MGILSYFLADWFALAGAGGAANLSRCNCVRLLPATPSPLHYTLSTFITISSWTNPVFSDCLHMVSEEGPNSRISHEKSFESCVSLSEYFKRYISESIFSLRLFSFIRNF